MFYGCLTRVTGEVFDIKLCLSGGGKWPRKPSRGNAGEGFKGTESVFLSHGFILLCSSHRDDNQLTSQCFKLSSLQKQIDEQSMKTPVTAYVTNIKV